MQKNEIELEILAKTEEAEKQIQALKKELEKFKKSTVDANKISKEQINTFKALNDKAKALRGTLTGLLTAFASIQGIKSFTEYSSKLEQGFIDIAKTTGLAGDSFKKLQDKLYGLTKELSGLDIFSLQEIAKQAGQLGIASNDIIDFTKSIAKISVALDLSSEEASSSMAKLSNVFKIPIKNVDRLGSSINELSANTTADVNYILDATKRIAGVGKQFGLSADEVMAFSATLSDIGVNAEVGATGLSQIFIKMQTETEKFAKVAGVSLTEFANKIKNDPIQAINLFLKALNKVDNKAQVLKDLGIGDAGAIQTLLGLADATDILNKNLKISAEAYKENTSIQKEYEVASNSIKAKQADITNALARLSKELVVELTPAIKEALDGVVNFIDSLDPKVIAEFGKGIYDAGKSIISFTKDNWTLIKTLLELIATFKALNSISNSFVALLGFKDLKNSAKALGLFNSKISTLPRLFAKADIAIKGLVKRFSLLRTASLAFISTPIGVALTAIGAGIGVLVYKYNKANEELERHNNLISKTSDVYNNAVDILKEYAQKLDDNGNITLNSFEEQKQTAEKLKETLREVNRQKVLLSKNNDNGQYDKQIYELEGTAKALEDAIRKVVKVKKEDIQASIEAARANKIEKQAQMELTNEHKKFVNDFIAKNRARLDNAKMVLEQLYNQEAQYNNKIEQLQRELANIYIKYNNERFNVRDDIASKYNNFLKQGLDEYSRYELQKTDIAKREEQIRQALMSNNNELAQSLLGKYTTETDDYINYEIQNLNKLGLTREQVEQEYKQLLTNQENWKLELINREEQAELKAHLAKIQQAQIELEATKAQIQAQQQMVDLLSKIQSQATGIKIEADYTGFEEAVKKIDEQLYNLEQQKKQIKVDLDVDKTKLDEIEQDTAPITKKVEIDTKNIDIKPKVDKNELNRDLSQIQKSNINIPVKTKLNKGALDKELNALNNLTTVSLHKVKIDASDAISVINNLKKPTSSTHTIYVKEVKQYSTGGFIKRQGRLSGYGGGDRIKALLEAGEYVLNKKAVAHYGPGFIEALNKMAISKDTLSNYIASKIPNIKINKDGILRLSTGGYIGDINTNKVIDTNSAVPVILNIGGKEFQTFSDEEVANSLKEYFDKYGGL